jgi:hypothetical protein
MLHYKRLNHVKSILTSPWHASTVTNPWHSPACSPLCSWTTRVQHIPHLGSHFMGISSSISWVSFPKNGGIWPKMLNKFTIWRSNAERLGLTHQTWGIQQTRILSNIESLNGEVRLSKDIQTLSRAAGDFSEPNEGFDTHWTGNVHYHVPFGNLT